MNMEIERKRKRKKKPIMKSRTKQNIIVTLVILFIALMLLIPVPAKSHEDPDKEKAIQALTSLVTVMQEENAMLTRSVKVLSGSLYHMGTYAHEVNKPVKEEHLICLIECMKVTRNTRESNLRCSYGCLRPLMDSKKCVPL